MFHDALCCIQQSVHVSLCWVSSLCVGVKENRLLKSEKVFSLFPDKKVSVLPIEGEARPKIALHLCVRIQCSCSDKDGCYLAVLSLRSASLACSARKRGFMRSCEKCSQC